MGEIHAYGRSLGCVSRRLFILATASVMSVLCFIQLFKWALKSELWNVIIGNSYTVATTDNCEGFKCFEVLSCYGMKSATEHIREPLVALSGAIVLPLGIAGAHHTYRRHLHIFAAYLAASAALHLGLVLGDSVYMQVCGAYPTNVIQQTLVNWLPPSPITTAAQAELLKMDTLTFDAVAQATEGFKVLIWYYAVAGSLTLFLAYAASEAHWLGLLAERGPLGLGVHYGLGQWDEVLSHDAVRRHKERGMRSKFIDDAILPGSEDEESVPFMAAGANGYGSVGMQPGMPVLLKEIEEEEEEGGYDGDYSNEVDEAAAMAAAAAAAAEEEEAAMQEAQRGFVAY